MLDDLRARWAARTSPRFRAFVDGKDAYQSFLWEMRTRFDKMTEEDYERAKSDTRLQSALRNFSDAIKLSDREHALADAAVARYQLAMIHHARGELDEAAEIMRAAVKVLSSLPHRDRVSRVSACLYHLGILAYKQGRVTEAVTQLRRSRQMDEAVGDLKGMQLCNLALDSYASQGVDIEVEDPSLPTSDEEPWEIPADWSEADETADTKPEATATQSPHFNQRELIWLISHSVQANDALMSQLNSLGDEFGRRVAVSRVAFGAIDGSQRHLNQPERDQHLCAAIFVLEKEGLRNRDFRKLADFCMRRVIAVPDFRLLVYLHDLTIHELRDLAKIEPLVNQLFYTTQIAQAPSLDQLRRTLVPYVRNVEHIRAAARWRTLRLKFAVLFGHVSTVVLFAAVLVALFGFPAWLLKWNFNWLGPHGPKMASLVLGLLAFPLQAPMIFFLLRGLRSTMLAQRDNATLMKGIAAGWVILIGANHFQYALKGPVSWIFLGVVIGILVDSIRRAGRRAMRQTIDLNQQLESAANPAFSDLNVTLLRGDPVKPFFYPLLPTLLTQAFISYTRESRKASTLAAALYRGLKGAGASPFLDQVSIPVGANWRRSLNEHIGECDVFICILDEKGVRQKWVAAELLAALEARRLTGTPDIIVLLDPAVQRGTEAMLPIFRGIVAATDQSPLQGRPQILSLNEKTFSTLIWGLMPPRFLASAVFTRAAALPIMFCITLLAAIGGLGLVSGYILAFFWMLEKWGHFPFTAWLVRHGWLEALTLLTAFWFGFTTRAAIAWAFERNHGRQMGATIPAFAAMGLFSAASIFVMQVSMLMVGWAVVLAVAGWMMVAATIRIGIKDRARV
jgi:hypothetical protein